MSEWSPRAINSHSLMLINCRMLTINLAKLTVHYNKYEYVGDRQVYGIQVHGTLFTANCWYLPVYKFTVH